MLSMDEMMQLIQSLIWLLAGVGIFIVGMNFMSDALEKSAGSGMKKLIERISNNRFSGVGIGAAVTAIIQSSSATSVMVIGLVNAGVMTLMQATPIIMGANIGTTITGVLVALKNDYFNMAMYFLAFAGVMMGFVRKEKVKIAGSLCSGLGLIFVGLNIMSSEQAFGNPLVETMFTEIFKMIDFPLLLILVGVIFTALIQSSSASTGVVITMVGAGVLPLDLALFIILGANIGTCVTALLASVGANANSRRVALIHFTFNVIGTVLFTALIWLFREPAVNLLVSIFPGDDQMSLQMRVSVFHVIFNVTTTCLLLPFVKQLVQYSCTVIKSKEDQEQIELLDERLMAAPSVAVQQAHIVAGQMAQDAAEAMRLAIGLTKSYDAKIMEQVVELEDRTDRYEDALGTYLVKLSNQNLSVADNRLLNTLLYTVSDIERMGDHALSVAKTAQEIEKKKIAFSSQAQAELAVLEQAVLDIVERTVDAYRNFDLEQAIKIEPQEQVVDFLVREVKSRHVRRLRDGLCTVEYGFVLEDLLTACERTADHCSNVAIEMLQVAEGKLEAHEYLNALKSGELHESAAFSERFARYCARYPFPEENQ